MIRKLFGFLLILLVFIIISSCDRERGKPKGFDEMLLHGTWRNGNDRYKYDPDYSGSYWDVTEGFEDDQLFTWSLSGSRLLLQHHITLGGFTAERFTILELTRTTLRVRDDDDNSTRAFTKN